MSRSGSIRIAALRRTFLGSFSPPEVPEDLSGISDEDLGSLEAAVLAAFEAARENARSAEAVAELELMATAVERIRAEAARRYEAAANQLSPEEAERQAAEVAARLAAGGRPGEPGVPPVPQELRDLAALSAEDRQALAANTPEEWAAFREIVGQPAPANELVPQRLTVALPDDFADRLGQAMAAALPAQPRRGGGLVPFSGIRQPEHVPARDVHVVEPIRPETTIVAGADIPGFGVSQHLDMGQVYEALVAKREMFESTPDGVTEKHLVARFRQAPLPVERTFSVEDVRENTRRLEAVNGPEALTASGGIVPVVEPYYDILTLAQADRPVRDSFPTFNAARGGIRLIPPPKMSDAAGSIGYITAPVDQAALGGSGAQITAATKPCLHVTCPAPVEYDVAAVTQCLEFGNFMNRTYPEQMPAWTTLAAANQAIVAEQKLLDQLSAVHTQVAEVNDKSLSATSQWLAQIAKYGAYLRNHHRMDPATNLRILAPAWAPRMFAADMLFRNWDDPSEILVAQAEIEGYLRDLNVTPTWYLDSGGSKGQLMNNGATMGVSPITFPANVVWHLFPEGSWLRLDSGDLDLGVVRDSSLNSLNNFRIFSETFEVMAFVGLEGLEVTSPLFASGLTAGFAYGSGTATSAVAFPTAY